MYGFVRFIADLHLFDAYSIDWRNISLDVYADTLITNWNASVEPEDLTIVVGDVGAECSRTLEVLRELKGRKVLVMGNHDYDWSIYNLMDTGIFQKLFKYIYVDGLFITHIPDESILHSYYCVHGHHHTYDTYNMRRRAALYFKDTYRLNCASDLIGHTPRVLTDLICQKENLYERMRRN